MPDRRKSRRWFPPASFYTPEKCRRCGVCCGATDGHPCVHLKPQADGSYLCEVYPDRLGRRRTVDGHEFICSPIQVIIEMTGGYEGCAYVEEIRAIRREMGQPTDDLGVLRMPLGPGGP